MADITFALNDPELGYTAFQVLRDTCTLSRGTASRFRETLSAGGCIHPGTPDMAQLLPEEERHLTFIVIYTHFPLSLGENPGGMEYTAPDRILYDSRIWNGNAWNVCSTFPAAAWMWVLLPPPPDGADS